jgi:hypothetical protein
MRTIRLIWVRTLALLCALCACSSTHVENGTDSTTHWLRGCDSAAECGGLSCLCGVCNTSCNSDQQCRGLDSTAVCMPTADTCTESEHSCARGPDRSGDDAAIDSRSSADAGAAADAALASSCNFAWYQCPDGCTATRTLQSASRSLAECAVSSGCDVILELSTAFVLDVAICESITAKLTVRNGDQVLEVRFGTLTPAAHEQAAQIGLDLAMSRSTIDAVTGCPSCAGADRATLSLDDTVSSPAQTFSYERGKPPAALGAADVFVNALIDEMLACEGPHLANCSIEGSGADAGAGSADGDVELQSPEPSGAALLDRPSVGDYTCTVSRPVSTLPIDPQSASAAVAQLDGVGHVFWIEGQMFGADGPLETAAVGIDGVLQTAHEVVAPDANVMSTSPNVRVVAAHDRLTVWWGYNTSAIEPLGALVQLDADGNALAPSRRFDGTPYPYDATIAATATGFVAAWGEPTSSGCDLTLLELDANADAVPGTRKTLASLIEQQPTDGELPRCAVQAITATPNGYALVYERSRSAGNIFAYQAFDTEGASLAPATRLTPPDSWRFDASLIAHGPEVFVAWSVVVGPNMNAHEVSATLRIARFGANGMLSGDVATLAPASEKQVDARAMWIDLGNELGLAWTRDQTLDQACTEACLHSAVVRYVVLDDADLTPHSTPVELEVTGADNPGLNGQLLAPNGADLLVLLSRWSYGDVQGGTGALMPATPASAALHCVH